MTESMQNQEVLTISLLQWDLVWEDVCANKMKVEALLSKVPAETDLVVLPEMFATGFSMKVSKHAETMDGETIGWMRKLAADYAVVLSGSLMIRENEKFYNRFVFVHPDGKIDYYDKRHLFAMGEENIHFSPGSERKVFQLKGFRILPQICYDLRFPVFSRNRKDCDLMINCASWPASRQSVWDILLKARAIENQIYVAGVNRIGIDGNGIRYSGGSQVVDAKGSVIENASNEEAIVAAKLNKTTLDKFRRNFPVLDDADDFYLS